MNSTKPLKVASILDSALDTQGMGENLVKYAQTRDPSLVKEKPGERVTWFYVRRIPTSLYQRYVMEATSEVDRRKRAFQVGVAKIENIVTNSGTTLQQLMPTATAQTVSGELEHFSERELEEIAPAFIEEIGEVANVRAFLPGKSALSFPLQGSFLRALELRLSLDAAEIRMSAQRSSEKPKAPSATSTEQAGAEPTAAIATDEATARSSPNMTAQSPQNDSRSTSSPAIVSTPAPGEPSTIPWSAMY